MEATTGYILINNIPGYFSLRLGWEAQKTPSYNVSIVTYWLEIKRELKKNDTDIYFNLNYTSKSNNDNDAFNYTHWVAQTEGLWISALPEGAESDADWIRLDTFNGAWYEHIGEKDLHIIISGEGSATIVTRSPEYSEEKIDTPLSLPSFDDVYNSFDVEGFIRKTTFISADNFTHGVNPTIRYFNPVKYESDMVGLQAGIFSPDGKTAYSDYVDIPILESVYTFELKEAQFNKLESMLPQHSDAITVQYRIKSIFYPRPGESENVVEITTINRTYMGGMERKPTINDVSVVDRNETTLALTGDNSILVKYHSNAFMSASVATYKNIDYNITITSGSKTTNSDGEIVGVDSNKFNYKVVDADGRVANYAYTHPENKFIQYFKPTCSLQEATIELFESTKAKIIYSVSGSFFNKSFGKENNVATLQVRVKEGGGEWGAWITDNEFNPASGNDKYDYTGETVVEDYRAVFTIQCKISDTLNNYDTTIEYALNITPVFDWSDTDFNFNVPVSFQGSVSFQGETMEDYIIEQGTTAMGSNGTWYWSKWKNGRAECYGCRNFGNMSVGTTWGGLFRSEAFYQPLPYIFKDTPEVIDISYRGSNFGGWIAMHEDYSPSESNTGGFILVRPASATISQVYISFHAIGRWK